MKLTTRRILPKRPTTWCMKNTRTKGVILLAKLCIRDRYNLVKFTFARQDWPAVIAAADKYRDNKTYKKNLPEVLYLQGEAYLKQNELDKALINCMNITGTYKGLVRCV